MWLRSQIQGTILSTNSFLSAYNTHYNIALQFVSPQLAVQFSIWDRIKDMTLYSNVQLENFAKFLLHLITTAALPISVLKVIEFGELDKPTLRFVRQLLLGILLGDQTVCIEVNTKWEEIIFRSSMFNQLTHFPGIPAYCTGCQIEGIQRQSATIHASFPHQEWTEERRVTGSNRFD